MSDKDCYLAYAKNPYNSTIRKEKNLVKQWEKDPDRYLSKEDIQLVFAKLVIGDMLAFLFP